MLNKFLGALDCIYITHSVTLKLFPLHMRERERAGERERGERKKEGVRARSERERRERVRESDNFMHLLNLKLISAINYLPLHFCYFSHSF